jgi:hypothetical protein
VHLNHEPKERLAILCCEAVEDCAASAHAIGGQPERARQIGERVVPARVRCGVIINELIECRVDLGREPLTEGRSPPVAIGVARAAGEGTQLHGVRVAEERSFKQALRHDRTQTQRISLNDARQNLARTRAGQQSAPIRLRTYG